MKAIVEDLTRREKEVAAHVALGKTNRQIAAALTIEVSTVENHVQRIIKKLGVENRTQVARYVLEHRDEFSQVG